MGVTVDPRAGSRTLIAPLRKLGVAVEVEQMAYGDVAWLSHDCVPWGVEHKRLADVMACIVDGRFAAHQLPGLKDCYSVVWLIVQDEYRSGPEGELLIRGKRGSGWRTVPWGRRVWFYSAVEHWLATMRYEAGVHVYHAKDVADSAAFIKAQWSWSQQPEHGSLKVLNTVLQHTFTRPGITKRMAACVPGVGYELAGRVAQHFSTPRRMVNATAAEWKAIPGIGPKIATRTEWLMREGRENDGNAKR